MCLSLSGRQNVNITYNYLLHRLRAVMAGRTWVQCHGPELHGQRLPSLFECCRICLWHRLCLKAAFLSQLTPQHNGHLWHKIHLTAAQREILLSTDSTSFWAKQTVIEQCYVMLGYLLGHVLNVLSHILINWQCFGSHHAMIFQYL